MSENPRIGRRNILNTTTKGMSPWMFGSQWSEPKSAFVKAQYCVHCTPDSFFIVSSDHWPIDTVAKICYACGRVHEYIDGLLLMAPREAVIEFQSRPWAVRRGVAIAPSDSEIDREELIEKLEEGLTPTEISRELHVERDFVMKIAVAAGFLPGGMRQ